MQSYTSDVQVEESNALFKLQLGAMQLKYT